MTAVVNNVETLSNIAWIVTNGAAAFRKVGSEKMPGTRLLSVSGHINRPGVYEVETGYPFARFLDEELGGMLGGRALKAVIPGGISAKVLTAAEIRPLGLDQAVLEAAGSTLGSGGMIVIADGTCMVRLLQVMLRFYHHESCGQCTPCRDGMGWLHRVIDRIVAGEGRPGDIETLYDVSRWNDGTTICGMGDAAGYATIAILDKFRDEFEYFIAHKRRSRAARGAPCLRSSSTGSRCRPGTTRRSWRRRASTASSSRTSAGTRSFRWPATAASVPCRSRVGAGWKSPATCR
jgi:NADH-quinone oxidoreductase subunit F